MKTYSNKPGVVDKPLSEDYTPDFITELGRNDIFVFGSNLDGFHAGGAARLAVDRFGAVWGQGEGLQGNTYAIPTMQGGIETIQPYVDRFIEFAKGHPNLTFYVTKIGCGIAGFKLSEITPLFKTLFLCQISGSQRLSSNYLKIQNEYIKDKFGYFLDRTIDEIRPSYLELAESNQD